LSLTTPTITTLISPDATVGFTVSFTSVGGDQVVANNLVIQVNSTSSEVYNTEIANFSYTHPVASGVLTNGTQYKAKIRTKDSAGNYSSFSDWVLFYCFTTPTIAITNITEGSTINSQTITVTGSYSQSETDTIKSYRFILYDENEILIYSYPEVISATITQLVEGLENNTTYHIQLLTISQSDVVSNTAKIGFTTSYITPALESQLTLTNLPTTGEVQVDILAVQVYLEALNHTFVASDWIDVTTTGAYVYADKRLDLISSDFTMRLHFKNIPSDTVFCTITGVNGTMTIKYYGNRFHVFKTANGLISHFVNDTDITFTGTDQICVQISQSNNLIDVDAEIYT